jgi:competence protein ComEC
MKNIMPLILILIFYAYPLTDAFFRNELIIWNIGQGQWITWHSFETCLHFDTGGEKIPWHQILNLCHGKTNKIFFSHKDKDHTQWAYTLFKKEPRHTCIATPINISLYPKNFQKIPYCKEMSDPHILQKLQPPELKKIGDTNFHSEVVQFDKFLLTGDSSQSAERFWVNKLKTTDKINVLMLGHHGSKTSTSMQLLNKLKHLKQCVSSSRQARYGHPHRETLNRIRIKKCPHLNTGQWGHIHFTY